MELVHHVADHLMLLLSVSDWLAVLIEELLMLLQLLLDIVSHLLLVALRITQVDL